MTAQRARTGIRVVLFGGAYFEPAALRFLVAVREHPGIELVGVFCQARGRGLRHRIADLVRRRGAVAALVLCADAAGVVASFSRGPLAWLRFRRRARRALRDVTVVPDLHAPDVLERIRALAPDLGLSYGSPVLRPQLFAIPRQGTLGIHHGRVPQYRGRKTTFWAMYNGERTAGVTIQKINAGLDTGAIVREGAVEIGNRRYRCVERDVEELGLRLYIDAILSAGRGVLVTRPQPGGRGPLYRQPRPRDLLHYYWMRAVGRRPRIREVR